MGITVAGEDFKIVTAVAANKGRKIFILPYSYISYMFQQIHLLFYNTNFSVNY
jgi:hypothetical protein